jgi:hypothetical protein
LGRSNLFSKARSSRMPFVEFIGANAAGSAILPIGNLSLAMQVGEVTERVFGHLPPPVLLKRFFDRERAG